MNFLGLGQGDRRLIVPLNVIMKEERGREREKALVSKVGTPLTTTAATTITTRITRTT